MKSNNNQLKLVSRRRVKRKPIIPLTAEQLKRVAAFSLAVFMLVMLLPFVNASDIADDSFGDEALLELAQEPEPPVCTEEPEGYNDDIDVTGEGIDLYDPEIEMIDHDESDHAEAGALDILFTSGEPSDYDCEYCDDEGCDECNEPVVYSNSKEIDLKVTGMSINHNGIPAEAGDLVLKNGDVVEMFFTWQAPHTWDAVQAITIDDGDFGYLRLWPAGVLPFDINYPLDGSVWMQTEYGSVVIGQFVLGPNGSDGLMRMTFNDQVEREFNVGGTISVITTIDYSRVPIIVGVPFDHFENFGFIFYFYKGDEPIVNIIKRNIGFTGTPENFQTIRWQIDVNTDLSMIPVSTKVIDTPATGSDYARHLIRENSVRVFEAIVTTNAQGVRSITGWNAINDGFVVDLADDRTSVSVTFDDMHGKAYRIELDTMPDAGYTGESFIYRNVAEIGGVDSAAQISGSGEIDVVINEKSGRFVGATNTTGAHIIWNITANYWGAELSGPLVITDVLVLEQNNPEQRYQKGSIQVFRSLYDPLTGSHSGGDLLWPGHDYEVSYETDRGFTLTIFDVKDDEGRFYTFDIEFRTDVIRSVSTPYINTASFNENNGNEARGEVLRGTLSADNAPQIVKRAGGINTVDQTMEWEIHVNPRGTSLSRIEINDFFGSCITGGCNATGHICVPVPGASMVLITDDPATKPFEIGFGGVPGRPIDELLTEGIDYKLIDLDTSGFSIVFSDNFEIRGRQLRIIFHTRYTLPEPDINGVINGGEAFWYTNRASMISIRNNDDINTHPAVNSGTVTMRLEQASRIQNAAKTGNFIDQQLRWSIEFNTSITDPVNFPGPVTVTDWWCERQSFVPGSIQVYTRPSGSAANAEWVFDSQMTDSGDFTLNDDGRGFTLVLHGVGNKQVMVRYFALRCPNDPVSQYINWARINDWPALRAVSPNIPVGTIRKTSELGAPNTVNWSLFLNQARLPLNNVVITDTLGPGQILNANSIMIDVCNEPTANSFIAHTTLVRNIDYFVHIENNDVLGETTMTITFKDGYAFNHWHRITYTSTIDPNNPPLPVEGRPGWYSVRNRATFTGDGMNPVVIEVERNNNWSIVIADGTSVRAPVYVEKVCAINGNGLAGAIFRLEDANGNILRENITTGDDGKAHVADLRAGGYRLIEVTPPEGYLLTAPTYEDFTVETASGQTALTIAFANYPENGSLRVTKAITGLRADTTIPGTWSATFTVTDAEGNIARDMHGEEIGGPRVLTWEQLRPGSTSAEALFTGLPPGLYTVTETGPDGITQYEWTSTGSVIVREGIEVISEETVIAAITNNYILIAGALEIHKEFTGDVRFAPVGWEAVFTVAGPNNYNESFAWADFTNGILRIEDLIPGVYTVTEAGGAIPGYFHTVTISDDGVATIVRDITANVEVTNNYIEEPRELTVIKSFTGAYTSTPPEWNALFTLEFLDGDEWEYVDSVLFADFSDGYSHTFTGLRHGAYRIIETSAGIAGYIHIEINSGVTAVGPVTDGDVKIENNYTPAPRALTVTKSFSGAFSVAPSGFNAMFMLELLTEGTWVLVDAVDFASFNNGYSHTFTNLARGTYRIVEMNAGVAGYTHIEINSGETVIGPVTDGTVTIENNYTAIPRELTVTKSFSGAFTSMPAGWSALFTLERQNGSEWEYVDSVLLADFSDGYSHTFTDLRHGRYRVVESDITGIAGYILHEINSGVTVIGPVADGIVTIENNYIPEPRALTVTKSFTGAYTAAPAGFNALFTLERLVSGTWIYEDSVRFVNFNSGSSHTFANLSRGSYRVIESYAGIAGYIHIEINSGVTVIGPVTDGAVTIENDYTPDEPIIPEARNLMIMKNFTGAFISAPTGFNALFTLERLAGDTWEYVDSVLYANFNSGSSHTFTNLVQGTYRVVESNAGVSGYTLITTSTWITLLTATTDGSLVITNNYTHTPTPTPTPPPPTPTPPPPTPTPPPPTPTPPPPTPTPPPPTPTPPPPTPTPPPPTPTPPPPTPTPPPTTPPPTTPPPTTPPPTTTPTPPPSPPDLGQGEIDILPEDAPAVQPDFEGDPEEEPFVIPEDDVPLAGPGHGVAWSLLNLIMSLIAIFNTVIITVTLFRRRRKANKVYDGIDEDFYAAYEGAQTEDEYWNRRLMRLKLPALLAGIIPGILFLLLENIRLPVVWTTRWTPLIGAFFIIHMALVLIQFVILKREQEEEDKIKAH